MKISDGASMSSSFVGDKRMEENYFWNPITPLYVRRDSVISASSTGSDTAAAAPPVPPKYNIGRFSLQDF